MIVVFAAMMLAQASGSTAVRNNLPTCLIYLSRMPRFSSKNDEQIIQDSSFLKAALNYCSDDVLPYWAVAHKRARIKLDIQSHSGQPLSPRDATKMIGEQDAAEQELLSIVGETLQKAIQIRITAPPIPDAVAAKFARAWLSDEENRSSTSRIIEKPISCIDASTKEGTIDAAGFMTGKMDSKSISQLREVSEKCGYMNAVNELSKLIQNDLFSGGSPQVSASAANEFLSQMVFWSFTEGP